MDSKRTPLEVIKNNRITEWKELAELVEFFSRYNYHDWLFRGVTSHEYQLIPKIGRPHARKMKDRARLPYSESDEIGVFNQFRDVSMPFLVRSPQTNIEWLALAQHHGLPTRFLDWTESILIAIWFAVGEYDPVATVDTTTHEIKPRTPAIWVVRDIERVQDGERGSPFAIQQPRSYRPAHISPRIAAQRSVLTIHGDPTKPLDHTDVWQIQIEPRAFFTLKKRIDACGINERSLFPGLDGVARDLAWRYKNNYLAGYR